MQTSPKSEAQRSEKELCVECVTRFGGRDIGLDGGGGGAEGRLVIVLMGEREAGWTAEQGIKTVRAWNLVGSLIKRNK